MFNYENNKRYDKSIITRNKGSGLLNKTHKKL